MTLATRLFEEAATAADVVRRQIARNSTHVRELGAHLRAMDPRSVVTCARGSSDHAATFAKYLIETRAGVLTSSAAPSVSSVYAAQPNMNNALFIAISQSGKSPDLLSAAQRARQSGARVLSLVNVEDSPLARMSDDVIGLCAGAETSVAASKSYLASLTAIVHLVAAWTESDELSTALNSAPALMESAWMLDWSSLVPRLAAVEHLYVVGRGFGLGLAQEAALKLKETCRIHAEAVSAAEIWHGPMAVIRPGFPVLVFAQGDQTKASVQTLTDALISRGADVMLAGAEHSQAHVVPTLDADPVIQPLLIAQSFYRFVNALALAKGLDPDKPPHLSKVTETL